MKKYFKYLVAVALVLVSVFMAKAQNSGYGCRIGDRVYKEKLGVGYYYDTAEIAEKYNLNGSTADVINGNGYSGYVCGRLNVYPSGFRWDAASHSNIPYDGETEVFTVTPRKCMATLSASTSTGGWGDIVQYDYNKAKYCANTPPMGLPIDDYAWLFIVLTGLIGAFIISKKGILA